MSIINSNGIWTTPQFYETGGVNLASKTEFEFTPTTINNSTASTIAPIVDFSSCSLNQKMHTSMDIIWSGFDTSNTNGTFSIYFQGDRYNAIESAWQWNGSSNMFNKVYNNGAAITNLVLSKTSGIYHVEMDFTLPADMPNTFSKHRFSIRSNYSNGTGKIGVKNLVVSPVEAQGSPIHVHTDYTTAREFYEI